MVDAAKLYGIKVNEDYIGSKEYSVFQKKTKDDESRIHAQCSIIFGNNGSGKSTIARAFKGGGAAFFDQDKNILDKNHQNVYLFNEEYVINNFRKVEDGRLEAIILLGDSVQIQDEIEDIEENISFNRKLQEEMQRNLAGLVSNKDNIIKNTHAMLARKDTSEKGELSLGSWKSRTIYYNKEGQYKNRPPKYIERLLDDSREVESIPPLAELLEEFKNSVQELKEAAVFREINWSYNNLVVPFDVNRVESAMQEVLVVHQKNEDDKIYSRVARSKAGASELLKRVEDFFKRESDFCPYCFQDIDVNHKESVIDIIQEYFEGIESNKEIQNLKNLKFSWRPGEPNLPELVLDEEIYKGLQADYRLLCNLCESLNAKIQEKVDNPEKDVSLEGMDPESIVNRINEGYAKVSSKVKAINAQGNLVEEIRGKCDNLNYDISVLETKDYIDNLRQIIKDIKEVEIQINNLKAEELEYVKSLNLKKSELKNESEAVVEVNKLLDKVFGSGGLSLQAGTDYGYRVMNGSRSIHPANLSTGEQNILALCYFFVKIANGERFNDALSSNKVIILDDPISSFDYENKYGVMGLLGYVAQKIFRERSDSKMLILTHDIAVAYELSVMFVKACGSGLKLQCWNLNNNLVGAKFDSVDEYKNILGKMYHFAIENCDRSGLSENEVRRVWEAFLSFELGETKISGGSVTEVVQKYFMGRNEQNKAEFAKFLVLQIYINSGSHSKNQMLMYNFALRPNLPEDGFKKLVIDVLCFIQLVSPLHIASRLYDKNKEIETCRDRLEGKCQEVMRNFGKE